MTETTSGNESGRTATGRSPGGWRWVGEECGGWGGDQVGALGEEVGEGDGGGGAVPGMEGFGVEGVPGGGVVCEGGFGEGVDEFMSVF